LSSSIGSSPVVARVIARLNVGGPAIHVVNLTAGLADSYRTVLITGRVDDSEGDMLPEARATGIPIEVIPELGRTVRPWEDAVALVKLIRLFRHLRPDIVHTHTAKAGTLGRIAAVFTRVPVRVHTFHGHVFRGYFGNVTTRLVVLAERILARFTTRIVTVSAGQATELVETFRVCGRHQLEVIALGLDLQRFAPEAIASLRGTFRREIGAGETPIVTIVGRLVPIKNHPLFLRTAAALTARGYDCTFVIVGAGEEQLRLRALAHELRIGPRVRFTGWRRDLPQIYADSDVVVLTSDNEGTPVSVIEALAAGCAVVATDVGGVREVLDGGRLGVLCRPGEAACLATAIGHLLDDPVVRGTMGGRGAREMPLRFGVGRLLADMSALYDRLLAGSERRRRA
jgi:glycosyltransferase involved in cell wall biosynthesis